MNYVFEELFKSLSMTAIHNEAVTHNWSEKYRKLAGPLAILIIVFFAGRDYLIYAILSPVIILCAYYSFGNVNDFITTCDKSHNDDQDWQLIAEEEELIEEEEQVAITRQEPVQIINTQAFICGSVFTSLQLNFPSIRLTLPQDIEVDSFGTIELILSNNEIKVSVSDGSSKYLFTLVDRYISEYDKDILSAFFNKTDKTIFVFHVSDCA